MTENRQIYITRESLDKFSFNLSNNDIVFVLTRFFELKEDIINNVVAKMLTIKENKLIDCNRFTKILYILGINILNIFFINKYMAYVNSINISEIHIDKGSRIKYVEISSNNFMHTLKSHGKNFIYTNINNLYIY